MSEIINLLDLLVATGDDEDARLAERLKLVVDSAPRQPIGGQTGYDLVFYEDFTEFDPAVWNTQYNWAPIVINNELQFYSDDAVLVEDSHLILRASEQSQAGQAYTSGVVTSQGKFEFTYGMVEIRAKVPAGPGLWPALWMLSPIDYPPEVDIMEYWGVRPDEISGALIWDGGAATNIYDGTLWADDFHLYQLVWTPERITWLVDGQPYHVATNHVPQQPLYLICNLAIGGSKGGPPDATTQFPADFLVDYIKVWQRQPNFLGDF